jgi:hypothetical protein
MNIIFGKEHAQELSNKYTVLELDTFQFEINGPILTAYCTIETVPVEELPKLDQLRTQHEHLLINYRNRSWNDCLIGISLLTGKWRGELDSFYNDLKSRVEIHIKDSPPVDWSPIILKPSS